MTSLKITDEPAGVDALDVSPVDGSLVYVTADRLVQTDAQGQNRIVKFTGPPLTDDPDVYWQRRIHDPAFSPDGTQIVYTLDGINLIPAGPSTRAAMVLPDRPATTPGLRSTDSRFYWYARWSPDGTKLLASFTAYEGQQYVIYDVVRKTQQAFVWGDYGSTDNGEAAWTRDGSAVVVASWYPVFSLPGLSLVDAHTGLIKGLIADFWNRGSAEFAAAPFSADGRSVLYFGAKAARDEYVRDFQLTLYALDYDTISIVNPRLFRLFETLWDPTGLGVAIVENGPGGPASWVALRGTCRDGPDTQTPGACTQRSVVAPLPIAGSNLRWGVRSADK